MDAFMCYGPVVPNGYGVCYNPQPNEIIVAVTSFNSCGETRSDYFASVLEGAFVQMRELCDAEKALTPVCNNNEAKNPSVGSVTGNQCS